MKEKKELINGHWYIYRAEEGEGVCKRCSNMAGKPFIYKGETYCHFIPIVAVLWKIIRTG